jgi:oxygen-independent coproporphyrinogen-3 oxidase
VKLQLLKNVIERLTENNRYVYIGMDHFAKPSDELVAAQRNQTLQRNFQGYSTRGNADIYAFGMSAISQIPDVYWQNQKELPAYYAALDAGNTPFPRSYILTDEDKIRRETIMRVMCDLSLDFAQMSILLDINFEKHFARELDALAPFEADGLVRRLAKGIGVTDTGRLFIRNIAMCFDNTLAPPGDRKFSRTI